jgi:hypothetical protein
LIKKRIWKMRNLLINELKSVNIKKPGKILLFRTNRMPVINMILETLKKSFPKSRIDVFAQPDVEDELKENKNVREVFINLEKSFSLNNATITTVTLLRNRRYDLAIVPYNNSSRTGYSDVEMLASGICRENIWGILPSGEIVQRTHQDITKDYIKNLQKTRKKEILRSSA